MNYAATWSRQCQSTASRTVFKVVLHQWKYGYSSPKNIQVGTFFKSPSQNFTGKPTIMGMVNSKHILNTWVILGAHAIYPE